MNNEPNNLNNGNVNTGNPVVDNANQEMVKGQGAPGAPSSVMQGIENANNTAGVMEGFPNAAPKPPVGEAPAMPNIMPGQTNSGINAQTMQVENPTPDTGVVDVPAAEPAAPGPVPEPAPAPGPMPGPAPAPGPMPEPAPAPGPMPEPAPAPGPMPGPAPAPGPVPEPAPAPGPMPGPAPVPGPMPGPAPAANSIGGVNSIPDPMDQVANGITSAEVEANNEFGEPKKKFPLTTREIILVSIALIGLVVVAILYIPKIMG